MKKIIGVSMIFALLLTGCSHNIPQDVHDDEKKQSRIEVYSAQDDMLLKTIDEQDTVNKLLDTSSWEPLESVSDDLTPEYILLVYQEKTLLAGQDPSEERAYELIETIITFQGSPYIKEIISNTVIKNMIIPADVLTSYYSMPDDVQKEFSALINE